jgi:ArsR family transcriptional regulator
MKPLSGPTTSVPALARAPIAERLAALADPLHLRMCRLLEREELSVGEVARALQLAQSTTSRRLKTLADAGWIARRSEGTATLFRLSLDDLHDADRALWITARGELAGDEALEEDDRRLAAVLAERRADSRSFFGRVAGEWEEIRASLFGRSFLAGALPALLPSEWEAADFGCGTGDASALLAPFLRRVIAFDQSDEMLEAARRRLAQFGHVEVLAGEAHAAPLADASVDLAVSSLLLHHVERPEAALAEMARVLRAGGRALVIDMLPHTRQEYRQSMGHLHLGFDPAWTTATLAASGFEGVRVTALPSDPEAKGPGLFVATARRAARRTER